MTPEPGKLLLRVVTPNGEAVTLTCDSIRLQTPDGTDGKNGGWLGVRRGHTDALIALMAGDIQAWMEGRLLRTLHISDGFATVKNDVVTVMCNIVE